MCRYHVPAEAGTVATVPLDHCVSVSVQVYVGEVSQAYR